MIFFFLVLFLHDASFVNLKEFLESVFFYIGI